MCKVMLGEAEQRSSPLQYILLCYFCDSRAVGALKSRESSAWLYKREQQGLDVFSHNFSQRTEIKGRFSP